MGNPKTVVEMVRAAKQEIENLTVEEAARELQNGEAVLVDIRESEERAQSGFIPEAIHVPRGMLEFYSDPASPVHRSEMVPDKRIILYCAGGARSALGVCTLQELGYTNVAHLEGGFAAWAAAGQPVEED